MKGAIPNPDPVMVLEPLATTQVELIGMFGKNNVNSLNDI